MGRKKLPRKNMSNFANRIYGLVGKLNISEFERKNGLSKSSILRIFEGAEPTRPTLEAILKGTNCNAEWLLTGNGSMFGPATSGEPIATDTANIDPELQKLFMLHNRFSSFLLTCQSKATRGELAQQCFAEILMAAVDAAKQAARHANDDIRNELENIRFLDDTAQ